MTAYAEKLILASLTKLKSAGHDPQACLDQSIMLGWKGVFPVRDQGYTISAETSAASLEFEAHRAVATKPPSAVVSLADKMRVKA